MDERMEYLLSLLDGFLDKTKAQAEHINIFNKELEKKITEIPQINFITGNEGLRIIALDKEEYYHAFIRRTEGLKDGRLNYRKIMVTVDFFNTQFAHLREVYAAYMKEESDRVQDQRIKFDRIFNRCTQIARSDKAPVEFPEFVVFIKSIVVNFLQNPNPKTRDSIETFFLSPLKEGFVKDKYHRSSNEANEIWQDLADLNGIVGRMKGSNTILLSTTKAIYDSYIDSIKLLDGAYSQVTQHSK
jgi:hypothetical protein